jgi:hypothetical protein
MDMDMDMDMRDHQGMRAASVLFFVFKKNRWHMRRKTTEGKKIKTARTSTKLERFQLLDN